MSRKGGRGKGEKGRELEGMERERVEGNCVQGERNYIVGCPLSGFHCSNALSYMGISTIY